MTASMFAPPVDPFEAAARMFEPTPLSPYVSDPVGWVQGQLGDHLWSKQRVIAESVRDHRRTAVKSCHNAGKSFLASRVAAWWIATHPPGEAFVASTAPSYPQVHAILWEEIRKAARNAQKNGTAIPGRVLQSDEWKLDDSTLVGWGRKPADTDEHGFQGIHRQYVLVILDEACGIPRQLWTAVEAITTGPDCRILAIGNPDDPSTEFADVCKPGSGWNTIRISAFDTPNFTDEPFPDKLRPLMLDPDWVEDKRKRWGEESPRYVSKVLGDFPDIGEDVLIAPSLIEAAQQREADTTGRAVLGVDVARFGSDQTVIYLRNGSSVKLVGEYSKQATTETTGRVIAAKRETGADEIRVDGVGVGGGVVDQLTEQGFGVLDMQAGAGAQDRERFVNSRAEWYWSLRERFEAGDISLDPADDELAAQLGAIKYKYTPRGQIQIESKDDMRKRGMPSPDRADAVMLTSVTSPGADLFRRLCWRHWTLDGDRLVTAGRSWAMNETWVFFTAHLPVGDDAVGDYQVVAAWARTLDGFLVLLDRARWKAGDAGIADQVRPLAARWRPDTMFVPKKQRSDVVVSDLYQVVNTTPLDVESDRMSRVFPASSMQAAGKVWLPTASWSEATKSEFLAFPHSRHSGMVEALGQAVRVVNTQYVPPPTPDQAMRRQHAADDPFTGPAVDFMHTDF
jgi:phage terminase large subunit-like protein